MRMKYIPFRFARFHPSGFPVGRRRGLWFCIPDNHEGNVAIFGVTGTGKTSALIIPALLSSGLPSFTLDVKGDILAALKSRGAPVRVLKVDGTGWGYNPFFFVQPETARRDVGTIVYSVLPTSAGEDYWTSAARLLLHGLLLFYFRKGFSFARACNEILSSDMREQVRYAMLENPQEVETLLGNLEGLNDKTFTCISSTLATTLAVFTEGDMQRVMSQPPEHCVSPADLLRGFNLVLRLPEGSLEFYRKFLQLVIGQLFYFFECQPDGQAPRANIFLDEFYRIGKIETILNGLATLRSKGIRIVIACQSLTQLEGLYGSADGRILLEAFRFQIVLGVEAVETQKYLSDKSGTVQERKDSFTRVSGKLTNSYHWETVPAIRPEEFGRLSAHNRLIVFVGGDCIELKKRPYFYVSPLKRLWRFLFPKRAGSGQPQRRGGGKPTDSRQKSAQRRESKPTDSRQQSAQRRESEVRNGQASCQPPAASLGTAAPKPPKNQTTLPPAKGEIPHDKPKTQQVNHTPLDRTGAQRTHLAGVSGTDDTDRFRTRAAQGKTRHSR